MKNFEHLLDEKVTSITSKRSQMLADLTRHVVIFLFTLLNEQIDKNDPLEFDEIIKILAVFPCAVSEVLVNNMKQTEVKMERYIEVLDEFEKIFHEARAFALERETLQ